MDLPGGSGAPEGPSDPLEPGRAAFNRGDYFLAHELWEEVWRALPGPPRSSRRDATSAATGAAGGPRSADDPRIPVGPSRPAKVVVQGLIQIAAGCHHLRNQRPDPGVRLLEKGLAKLERGGTLTSPAPSGVGAFAVAVRALAGSWSGGPSGAQSDPGTLKF